MATIMCLPDEVISIILEKKSISIGDIGNFKSTCKRFHQLALNNKLWEKKFYQRCPAKKKLNAEKRKKTSEHFNFKKQIEAGIKCINKLHYCASVMSCNYVSRTDLKKFECYLHSTAEDSMMYYFVLDGLNRIISAQLPWQLCSDLTSAYNLNIIYRHLKQYRLVYKKDKFLNMPKEKHILERALIIVTQYFQPHVSYSVVNKWLDDIAQEVLSRLKNEYPAHSIFSTSPENFSVWRNNNINDNFWGQTEATQILNILKKFIFSELIYKLDQLWTALDLEEKCVNCISNYIRIYLLATIYHSVARRLGLYCILDPSHEEKNEYMLILWMPKYNVNFNREQQDLDNKCFYVKKAHFHYPYPYNIIRATCNSEFYRIKDSIFLNRITLYLQSTIEIFNVELQRNNIDYTWEANTLIKIITELRYFYIQSSKYQFYIPMPIRIKYDKLKSELKYTLYHQITESNKIRNHKIKFAVGMIVAHRCKYFQELEKFQGYNIRKNTNTNYHTGVIIGWQYRCDSIYREINSMCLKYCFSHHHFCSCNKCCPHYLILTDNNVICSVSQDNVWICPPRWINNVEIGFYFSKFEGTHYVPNKSLTEDYPSEIAAIDEILAK